MFKSKKILILALAVVAGAGPFLPSVFAAGDTLVTICYRGRTIQVPFYLMTRYTNNGATPGTCPTSPPPM